MTMVGQNSASLRDADGRSSNLVKCLGLLDTV